MKTRSRSTHGGFTLVELLTVVAIIAVLAALVLGGMMLAQEKQRQDKAKIQVQLLSNALEQYKAENGAYPENDNATGSNGTSKLFEALFHEGATTEGKKIYLAELDPAGNKQGWLKGSGSTTTLLDPWKNEYRYRTGASATNPDFDLWSMGKDGQTNPDDPKAKESLDDIRN